MKIKMFKTDQLSYFLSMALAIIKVPRPLDLTLLEAKGNHLVDTSAKNGTLKETIAKTLSSSQGYYPK